MKNIKAFSVGHTATIYTWNALTRIWTCWPGPQTGPRSVCHCWLMGDSSRLSSTMQVSHSTALLTTKWSRWRKPLFRGRCTWSTGSDPCHPWRSGHQHSFCLRVWVTPTNEVIHHGACLGLGLAALRTADEEIYEDTKGVLYTENTNLFINIMTTWYIAKRA
jgi:hypothetical protein